MKQISILLALVLGLVPVLSGQTKDERTCRIVFPGKPKDAASTSYLFDGQRSLLVTLPGIKFSEVIALPMGEITLRMTGEAIIDPADVPLGAPAIRVPESVKDFYILVSSDPENLTLPLKIEMVAAGDGGLKAGETLWYNMTDHRIQGKLGDASISVEPKEMQVTKDPLPNSGYFSAEFTYKPHGKGDVQRITEQQWWYDAQSRHLGCIVNSGGKLPRIYYFRDFRLPQE